MQQQYKVVAVVVVVIVVVVVVVVVVVLLCPVSLVSGQWSCQSARLVFIICNLDNFQLALAHLGTDC